MEQNSLPPTPEKPASEATPTPQPPAAPKAGNIFSKHKVWWLVLVIICLIFSLAFPGNVSNPEFFWASVIGNCVGKFLVAFLLAGFVWLLSLLGRSKTTSAQFMSCFTVALVIATVSQLFVESYRNEAGNGLQQQVQQEQELGNTHTPPGNQLVQQYRQYNPQDNRPDDDITLEFAVRYPDKFQQFPDAVADYRRITNSVEGQYMLARQEVLNNCEIFDSHLYSTPDGQGGIYASKIDGRIRNKSTKTISMLTLKISIYGADKSLIDTKGVMLGVTPNLLEELAPGDVKSFDAEVYIPRVPAGFTWSYSITDATFH